MYILLSLQERAEDGKGEGITKENIGWEKTKLTSSGWNTQLLPDGKLASLPRLNNTNYVRGAIGGKRRLLNCGWCQWKLWKCVIA